MPRWFLAFTVPLLLAAACAPGGEGPVRAPDDLPWGDRPADRLAFAAREAVARAAARGFQPAESAPAAERPLPKSSPENELSWVKGGSVPIVKATRPKEVPLVFPPGTFDIRQQDAQRQLKQAQRFAPTRASG